jgi:DNA repair exonuclease SbcCD ATPase subunit
VELESFEADLSEVKEKIEQCVKRRSLREKTEKRFQNVNSEISEGNKEMERIVVDIKTAKKELSQTKSKLVTVENRFLMLSKELKGYDKIVEQMKDLDSSISELQTEKGSIETKLTYTRKAIESYREDSKKRKDLIKTVKDLELKAAAYRHVSTGFSRYNIPVKLLRNLRTALEKKATRIYHEFAGGSIRIDDVEGSKPGIDFVLEDESGKKSYKVLSSGEKVMVFLSIRCALTQIINATRNNKIDFLILDEVAGNLSPSKREDLTKLINKLLRTFFPQVFMVSHVELRDIFNKTLHVVKEGGISHVKAS